jgi:SAM-dependent methyltransferase
MAKGYARSRPAVHPRILALVSEELGLRQPFECALDVGCGSGVSLKALDGLARRCVGLEPAESMLRWAREIAPTANLVRGRAENLPFRDSTFDLITAAGSLNYADLPSFFAEAARVLLPHGLLVVYDFSAGRSFRDSERLDEWFSEFRSRYPAPANEARELNPGILAQIRSGFQMRSHRLFEIGIPLEAGFYLNYMMTETNVAAALRGGASDSDIRQWCAETLSPVWGGLQREVVFRGYFACLSTD